MPHAFVHLYPELEAAIDQSLVLTTTERLRRNLIRAYSDAKLSRGLSAWPTPRIQTVGGYLSNLYRAERRQQPELPVLLGPEAEYALFRATAPAGRSELIPLAREAWNLCHQWGIEITAGNFGATENGLAFSEWSERLSRRLAVQNAITRAELTARVELKSSESSISCLSFEHLPSALAAWLDSQTAEIVNLSATAPAARTTDVQRTSFNTPADELAAVARWVRNLLETGTEVRIGVIVPDLGSRYDSVLRQFTAELDPWLETGTEGLLDIGGGTPLRTQPIWQPARDWLSLCFDQLDVESIRNCLNSAYLDLPALPTLPAHLAPSQSLPLLDRQLDLQGLDPELVAQVRLLRSTEQTLGDWIANFLTVLNAAGWTGQRAGSVQYQAWQELTARLDSLGTWGDGRPMNAREALDQVDQFLAEITFAPERAAAPVQIIGYLESTGLDFTHLWVLGLDDESWPRLPSPNPLIPIRLQKQHQLPRTTPEQEAAFARERLEHWQRSTDTLLVSHVRHLQESERRPSPLIRKIPVVEQWEEHRPHPGFEHSPQQLESVQDTAGLPLESGRHRGGTGRLRDQAACPFRGYAIHRLGLKEIRPPHGLPDALDRGTLIHEALHRLYENAATDGLMPTELSPVHFAQAADQALARHYGRFPAPFRERERERLVVLLDAWNQLESTREDISIEELELGIGAEFDGIGLNLRIDRIDRIGDAYLVIDYKTGRIGHRLTHDRLLDPQLPLYALTNESVRGVLYAEVNEARPRLKGIAAMDLESVTLDSPAEGSWEAQRARWQSQIDTLTDEIRSGFAAVTPYDSRACQTCHLHSFCRIAAAEAVSEESN